MVVQLSQQGIDKFSFFFTDAYNQLNIVRSNDDAGEMTDMAGKPAISNSIECKFLAAVFSYNAYRIFFLTIYFKLSFQAETFMTLLNIQLILAQKIAFCKT